MTIQINLPTQLRGPEAASKLLALTWGGTPVSNTNRYGVIALPTRDEEGKLVFGYTADHFIKLSANDTLEIGSDTQSDVYFVPSVLKSQANRRRDNCAGSHVAWLDYDAPTTLSDLLSILPIPPSAVVQSSPTKFHVYWKLDHFVSDVEEVQFINAWLMYNTPGAVDADASGYDATQLLRLPMGVNAKQDYDEPFRPALVVYEPDRVIDSRGEYNLPVIPPESAWKITTSDTQAQMGDAPSLDELKRFPDYAVRQVARLLEEGAPNGKRGRAIYQIVKTLQASDFDLDDIVSWIAASPLARRYDGSEERLLRDVERIWDKHVSTTGVAGDSVSGATGTGSGASGDTDPDSDGPFVPGAAEQDKFAALRARLYTSERLDEIPELPPLIDGMLSLNSVARIFGESTAGKSFVAIDFAGCVGTGMEWHGRFTQMGKVLYIVAEGEQGIKKRVRLWEDTFHRTMDNVFFLPEPFQVAPTSDEWREFVEFCESERFSLIIFDTQARVTVGVEENGNSDFVPIIDAWEDLRRRTGGCVLVVHHVGSTDPRRARGNTGVRGALQTEILVTRDKKAGNIEIEALKQKDDEETKVSLLWNIKPVPHMFKKDGTPQYSVVLTDGVQLLNLDEE